MLALIGSHALSHHININRIPKDVDLIGSYDEIVAFAKSNGATSFIPFDKGRHIKMTFGSRIIEAGITWEGSSSEAVLEYIRRDPKTLKMGVCGFTEFLIPSLNLLYMLKMSHRFKKNSPHFLKTMDDIHHMRFHGAHIETSMNDLYKFRQKETYDYGHPKLNQNKMGFFSGDGVKYVYDHDSIHEAIKVHEKPAYQYFKMENQEVLCSRSLFEASSSEIQLAAVYEEACVLALERSLIPFPGVLTPKRAFEVALMKVCTSITSGWFREFAWENYHKVLQMDQEFTYWNKFQKGIEGGIVKKNE